MRIGETTDYTDEHGFKKRREDIPACHAVDPWRRRACHAGRRVPHKERKRGRFFLINVSEGLARGDGGEYFNTRADPIALALFLQ